MMRRAPLLCLLAGCLFACAPDDNGDDGAGTSTGSSSSTGEDPSATASASMGTTAGWVDCASLMGDACDDNPQCALYPSGCAVDCAPLPESICDDVGHCAWDGSACVYGP
ncbi:MAG: hypothetical protein IPK74_17200 [Deltaproteobacteria bacterium]|nr:hypothetical protein [Deltaproteobacteria bacterium]